jgi:hypothetical protein
MKFGNFHTLDLRGPAPWLRKPLLGVATIKWYLDWGGSDNTPDGTPKDLSGGGTKIRWKSNTDMWTIDAADAMPIPGAGNNYSYWGQFYMEMTARPGSEVVNNMKYYTDGGDYGTGITLYVGDEDPVRTSALTTGYDLATGTPGTTGDRMDSGANKHTDLTARTDAFSYVTGTPRSLTIGESGNALDLVGETCNYLVMQLDVDSTASSGTKTAETQTGRYDES